MNLGPNTVASTYQYVLNQSGSSITLGSGQAVNWIGAGVVVATGGTQTISGSKSFVGNFYVTGSGSYNEIGTYSIQNHFGDIATQNLFGSQASSNFFGYDASYNSFGSAAGTNEFYGTVSVLNTGKIRLANFTGASSQDGLRGELRVSGSGLYVCTGASAGWGRVFLSSF